MGKQEFLQYWKQLSEHLYKEKPWTKLSKKDEKNVNAILKKVIIDGSHDMNELEMNKFLRKLLATSHTRNATKICIKCGAIFFGAAGKKTQIDLEHEWRNGMAFINNNMTTKQKEKTQCKFFI